MTDEPTVSPEEQQAFNAKWDGRFEMLAGKAKEAWGDITDDVVTEAEGNVTKLFGYIKAKTGESAEAIIAKLDELTEDESDDSNAS